MKYTDEVAVFWDYGECELRACNLTFSNKTSLSQKTVPFLQTLRAMLL